MRQCRYFLPLFALLLFVCDIFSAEITFTSAEVLKDLPWFHRRGTGFILEAMDSDDILTRTNHTATFRLMMTSREVPDASVSVNLKVVVPHTGKVIGERTETDIVLPIHKTCIRNYKVQITKQDYSDIVSANNKFNLTTLTVKAEFRDADGTVIKAFDTDANIGVAAEDSGLVFPQAAIVRKNGHNLLEVNGKTWPGLFGYVGWSFIPGSDSVRTFGATGRHINEVTLYLDTLWEDGTLDAGRVEKRLNQIVTSLVAEDPDTLICFRWNLYVPEDWGKHWPDELIVYDDGTKAAVTNNRNRGLASYASSVWKEQYTRSIRDIIRRIKDGPYADRVFMIKIGYGNCGEWNHFGYFDSKFPDYSVPMQKAFIAWLQNKYSNLAELNRRWRTSYAQWDKVGIPDRTQRLAGGKGILRNPSTGVQVRDYYEFFNKFTVTLIDYFGGIVKEESNGKLLFGTFYAYFGHHIYAFPYHSLDSGHYALGELLKSRNVDVISSPYNYHNRKTNCSFSIALASIQAHGKLFLGEYDLQTHYIKNPNAYHHHPPFLKNAEDTNVFYWRDYARALTLGIGAYWYDFCHGWFDYPEFKDIVAKINRANELAAANSNRSVAEVAVLVDEAGVLDLSLGQAGQYGRSLYRVLGDVFDQAGAPWDCFLSSDIDQVVSNPQYKVIVFLNQYRQNETIRRELERFHGSVLFISGAGQVKDNQFLSETAWSGIHIIEAEGHAQDTLTVSGKDWKVKPQKLDPLFVPDSKAQTVIGNLQTGEPGFAYVKRNGGNTWYFALPEINSRILIQVYGAAGVHRYAYPLGVYVYANESFLAVWHPNPAFSKIHIKLKRKAAKVVDLWDLKTAAENTSQFDIHMTPHQPFIKLYFYR